MSESNTAFHDCAQSVSQAITAASAAIAQGKVCDLAPLSEMIDTLCEEAKIAATETDDAGREEIGAVLQSVVGRMDTLEQQLRDLIERTGGGSEDVH